MLRALLRKERERELAKGSKSLVFLKHLNFIIKGRTATCWNFLKNLSFSMFLVFLALWSLSFSFSNFPLSPSNPVLSLSLLSTVILMEPSCPLQPVQSGVVHMACIKQSDRTGQTIDAQTWISIRSVALQIFSKQYIGTNYSHINIPKTYNAGLTHDRFLPPNGWIFFLTSIIVNWVIIPCHVTFTQIFLAL